MVGRLRNGKFRPNFDWNTITLFCGLFISSTVLVISECSCSCSCRSGSDECSESCSSESCSSSSEKEVGEEHLCRETTCKPPNDSNGLLVAAKTCEYGNVLPFIGTCDCTSAGQFPQFKTFQLFYDRSLLTGRQNFISASLILTCHNTSLMCVRGEDNQFYTPLEKKQQAAAFLYMHLFCDGADTKPLCQTLMSYSSSMALPLVAQNGTVLTLAYFDNPIQPTEGLLPVFAVSCHGCAPIRPAAAVECHGTFEPV